VIIESVKMIVCIDCAKLGSAHWEAKREYPRHLPKTGAKKTLTKTSPIKRRHEEIFGTLNLVEDFGLRIRQAREKRGLIYEDLGRRIGEKVSVLKKIESGKMMPDQKLATKLEHELKIKLLVPSMERGATISFSPPSSGVTLGEIVHLKAGKKEVSKEREQS